MNGNNFLIDSNIIIYLTQGKLNITDFAKKGSRLYISSIVYMEALGYSFANQLQENLTTELCNAFGRIFLTKEIEARTILIRKNKKIKLPDAIIAATAIVYNFTLVTHNNDDFKDIPGLTILDPFS
ncbi:MAG: type II toxin-antitoxin system VapC family toxin [Chitinophagaceae bacterium]|jgi:predicted nucleic acid-binding protein|nr:type II toxin-antitoxin system VapC family toxin [Chitinophagaceae bacterium]